MSIMHVPACPLCAEDKWDKRKRLRRQLEQAESNELAAKYNNDPQAEAYANAAVIRIKNELTKLENENA